jgi:hypothetical protein
MEARMILHHNGRVYRLVKHQPPGASCSKCQILIDKHQLTSGDCPRVMGLLACIPEGVIDFTATYRFIHNTEEALAAYVAETLGAETTP